MDEILVSQSLLQSYYEDVLNACGVPAQDAAIVGDTLVDADLRGVSSHGLINFPYYVDRLRHGGANPTPRVQAVTDLPGLLLLDGDGGLGQVASARAMQIGIARARTTGAAAVFVHNSNHFGMAAYFSMLASAAGMIGVATTNAPPSMSMWGGTGRTMGNNPLAIAIPAGDAPALVLDIAMSVAAGGKVRVLGLTGREIPLGWALDTEGRPTTDPTQALLGSLMPFAGPKGSGLALMIDLLCGTLTGARDATEIPVNIDVTQPENIGHLFLAIDAAAFQPLDAFRQRVDTIIGRHKAVPPAEGAEEILMPGEREYRLKQQRLQTGIPFGRGILDEVGPALTAVGIPLPW
jgi:LDH2 family malate/lactate/ureidoglycolate dehydrogenase